MLLSSPWNSVTPVPVVTTANGALRFSVTSSDHGDGLPRCQLQIKCSFDAINEIGQRRTATNVTQMFIGEPR